MGIPFGIFAVGLVAAITVTFISCPTGQPSEPEPTPVPQEKAAPEPTLPKESPSLIDELKAEEGFRAKPYRDSEGVLTIGYGLNLTNGITRSEADWILRSRIGHSVECLERNWDLFLEMPPRTQDALTEMGFQVGCVGLLNFKGMLAALDKWDCAKAKEEALDSDWARETPERAKRVTERLC